MGFAQNVYENALQDLVEDEETSKVLEHEIKSILENLYRVKSSEGGTKKIKSENYGNLSDRMKTIMRDLSVKEMNVLQSALKSLSEPGSLDKMKHEIEKYAPEIEKSAGAITTLAKLLSDYIIKEVSAAAKQSP